MQARVARAQQQTNQSSAVTPSRAALHQWHTSSFAAITRRSAKDCWKKAMMSRSTLTLLACIAPLHALTPPKSHAAPTPSVRRRTAMRVRGGDNATDALRVRGGTGKKAKKPRKRGGHRWPTYGRSSRDRSRRESRAESKPADAPVVETPVAKDFNQLKEVPQGWIDRTCEEIKISRPTSTSTRLTG